MFDTTQSPASCVHGVQLVLPPSNSSSSAYLARVGRNGPSCNRAALHTPGNAAVTCHWCTARDDTTTFSGQAAVPLLGGLHIGFAVYWAD